MEVNVTSFSSEYGEYDLYVFIIDGVEVPVIYKKGKGMPVLRLQSQCFLGITFRSIECDCGKQFENVMKYIQKTEHAIVIFFCNQEARGYGLYKKIDILRNTQKFNSIKKAREVTNVVKDLRDYSLAAEILKKLQIYKVDILTNNKKKVTALENNGIEVNRVIEI